MKEWVQIRAAEGKRPDLFIVDGRDQPDHQRFKSNVQAKYLVVIARYAKFLSNALVFYRWLQDHAIG